MSQRNSNWITAAYRLWENKIDDCNLVSGAYWLLVIGIFAVALIVRVTALDNFITADEPHWVYRSSWFLGGLLLPQDYCPSVQPGRSFDTQGWGCTLQSGHPGVTTMWGAAPGLLWYYWQHGSAAGLDLRSFLGQINPDSFDSGLLAPLRLPVALINFLFLIPFFIWLRWLLDDRVALVATLLVALNPTHVALSRILGHDALVSNFMVLSVLAILGYWWQGWPRHWLVISAILAGLACLSKSTGWFMGFYIVLLAGVKLYARRWDWPYAWRLGSEVLGWSLLVGLTYFVFWPAMWVIPLEVIHTVFDFGVDTTEAGHSHYFLGQVSSDPGPLFYPLGWLVQASPFEVLGLLALLIGVWFSARSHFHSFINRQMLNHPVEAALGFFFAALWLVETISAKKMVRYLLPGFLVLDIFAAIGLLWLLDYFLTRREKRLNEAANTGHSSIE